MAGRDEIRSRTTPSSSRSTGSPSSAFKSVSGLAAEAEVIEYREGSDPVSLVAEAPRTRASTRT